MSARKHTRPSCFIEILESRKLMDSTLLADFNADAHVNSLDFTVLAVNFNGTNKTHAQGDATGDGRVNAQDFNILADQFGRVEQMSVNDNFVGTTDNGSGHGDINVAGNWSQNRIPTVGDIMVFNPANYVNPPQGQVGAVTVDGLSIVDGSGLDFGSGGDDDLSLITVTGNSDANNTIGLALAGLGGNLTGTGNTGAVIVTTKTGTASVAGFSQVQLNILAASSQTTVGADVTDSFIIGSAGTSAKAIFNSSSMGGSPKVDFVTNDPSSFHGEFVANKTTGDVVLNLQAATLQSNVTLTSQLNGVTVTDGTGGTFSNYHQHQSWTVGGSKTPGGTVTVTVPSNYTGSGFTPTLAALSGYGGDPVAGSLAGSTFSFVVPADMPLGNTGLLLQNGDDSIEITLDTITVTAAASGAKNNRLALGLGGLGL